MDTLTVELGLVPIDLGIRPEFPIINLAFKNSKGVIKVGNSIIKATGVSYKFTLKRDKTPKINDFWEFTPHKKVFILCISLSLANPLILFSPISFNYSNPLINEERPLDSLPKVYPAQKISIKKISLEIEEEEVLNIIERILPYEITNRNRNVFEKNIIESIQNYKLALTCSNSSLRFNHLYIALEKAVNAGAGNKEKKGDGFDKEASRIAGLDASKIKKIRQLIDREKHIQKGKGDIKKHEKLLQQFDSLIAQLKIATDRAILYRLKRGK